MKTHKCVSAIILIIVLEVLSSEHQFGGGAKVDAHPLQSLGNPRTKREHEQDGGAVSPTPDKSDANANEEKKSNNITAAGVSTPTPIKASTGTTSTNKTMKPGTVVEHTMIIPDRSPENLPNVPIKNEGLDEDEDDQTESNPGQNNFDEKAVQRALIVIAGIAVIIVAYLGVKFILIKKRKVVKRYGRVEASEMDLLDEIDDDESEEEEELFDINQQRRS